MIFKCFSYSVSKGILSKYSDSPKGPINLPCQLECLTDPARASSTGLCLGDVALNRAVKEAAGKVVERE